MNNCSVQHCPNEGTETIPLSAKNIVNQPLPYVVMEIHLDVPICAGHYNLLSKDYEASLISHLP